MDEQEEPRQPPPAIFACSGASDTGAIGDAAARESDREGVTRMYCLAGVGTRVAEIVSNPEVAERLIAVDGCENDCARRMLEAAGFRPAIHIRLTELGLPKYNSTPTQARIRRIKDEIRKRIEEEGL